MVAAVEATGLIGVAVTGDENLAAATAHIGGAVTADDILAGKAAAKGALSADVATANEAFDGDLLLNDWIQNLIFSMTTDKYAVFFLKPTFKLFQVPYFIR